MASPSTSRHDKGFTMVEILVVMGIFIVLMGIGGVIGFNAYKGYLFRSERSTAVSVLERARSRAMANYYGEMHGVCYDDTKHIYILFRGDECKEDGNEVIGGNPNSQISLDKVVFARLSGNMTPTVTGPTDHCEDDEKEISVTEQDKTSYICINNQGRINW
jgi:Tfp pilus assembly protein PilE